ncbi:MAG: 50S ribosomal protein L18 [Clostridiales bacterium]|jgi:large subunit ribosomal protein L18|nr:50S ribosomal protein L18 [Clostridiales bacterium]MBQ4190499.1 50S ribosomal protein L18 [Clostridiales bacterium]MBQ4217781.1 50S ribosomal protein L18 [Clostridiales bacterium]MBR5358095.1 50S ribosomal protein L18 [Clostridiales bacterium]MBR6210732.1 50S ribosomal protein L18 [Clostridiales bacterium]
MIGKIDKNKIRKRKHVRVRKKISGTADCPRLCVYRSNSHIYAQIIDDEAGVTLVSASSLDKDIKGELSNGSNIQAASAVGKLVAERAAAKEIKDVVFDRGGYLYHGRVQALAEAAREAGLNF